MTATTLPLRPAPPSAALETAVTATPTLTTKDDRIARMFRGGDSLDRVSEAGAVNGWTRADATRVASVHGWDLDDFGRIPAAARDQLHPPRQQPLKRPPQRSRGAGPYIAALNVDDLFADRVYQRPLDVPRVKRMITAWDPRMLGILDVADRGPAAAPRRYAIINGQHRWSAARQVGVGHLACNVHEGLSREAEAQLMYELDRTTRKLSGFDQWRARRGAGDEQVLTVEAVCAGHGLRVAPDPADGVMRAYGAAEKLLQLGGRDLLDGTLGVLAVAYGAAHLAYQSPLLTGLGQLLHHNADINLERMSRALSATRPEQLRATATALRDADGGSLHQLMSRAIAGQYNRTPGPGPRLTVGR